MKRIFVVLLILVCILTGCTLKESVDTQAESEVSSGGQSAEQSEGKSSETGTEDEFSGSYTVPKGWMKAEKYSTDEKFFYVEEGHETDEFPDNISINEGTNRYSLEDHAKFREAILQQLLMQVKGIDAAVTGNGSYTEQGNVLYTFSIAEEDVTTTQYYILKDYGYCLVHLTNYSGSESSDEAAKMIVDSFVWN